MAAKSPQGSGLLPSTTCTSSLQGRQNARMSLTSSLSPKTPRIPAMAVSDARNTRGNGADV